jgi:hypothetical protein
MAPVTRPPMALKIDCRTLTNRVTTSFMLVGNSADSRRLAQCRDTGYGTPPHAYAKRKHSRVEPTWEAVGSGARCGASAAMTSQVSP